MPIMTMQIDGIDSPGNETTEYQSLHLHTDQSSGMYEVWGRGRTGKLDYIASMPRQMTQWFLASHLSQILGIPIEEMEFNPRTLDATVSMLNKKGAIQ